MSQKEVGTVEEEVRFELEERGQKSSEKKESVVVPRDPKADHPYVPHNGENRQYMRDIILGINDGLVSMFLVCFGMAGGGADSRSILLAAITGAVAGAISMAAGEYLATKSQAEVVDGDLALEKEHFTYHRDVELEELRQALATMGLNGGLLEQVVQTIGQSDDAMMKFMMAFEFGYTEADARSPIVAMLMSGALFITGSLPSVIPFAATTSVRIALIVSGVLCCLSLFFVGAIKCIATRGNWLWSGTENLLIGGIGAAISYAVGLIYDVARG
eukprot:TRINITY_DN864_c0_g1_i3.p2 TRINITY_DN864_c0_g1~~TRINITY_DN864_c0_g1_i3.p2  ORF type:complete len:305 (+),score=128.06 TRINITY_DN864_c0_g1_i3:98-916(+)